MRYNNGYSIKEHWITVSLDGSLEEGLIKGLIDHSYELIQKSLTKKQRKELGLARKLMWGTFNCIITVIQLKNIGIQLTARGI